MNQKYQIIIVFVYFKERIKRNESVHVYDFLALLFPTCDFELSDVLSAVREGESDEEWAAAEGTFSLLDSFGFFSSLCWKLINQSNGVCVHKRNARHFEGREKSARESDVLRVSSGSLSRLKGRFSS